MYEAGILVGFFIVCIIIIAVSIAIAGPKKKNGFVLYSPSCGGINREECLGLTSGNMPVIDATSYDWFRSQLTCFGGLGVPP